MHTTETDGRATLEEMAEAARALGYEYIAITDHSKALAMANGLDEKRAVAFRQAGARAESGSGLGIRIFSGLECDIRRDGEMDLAEDALAELDIVVGSVHSHMNLEVVGDDGSADARARIAIAARAGPSHRPHAAAIAIRFRSISNAWRRRPRAATCIWKSTAARSGSTWAALWSAPRKALGAKFAISTDAHQTKHLAATCRTASSRRGAAGWKPRDVLNALPLAAIHKGHPQIMKLISSVEKLSEQAVFCFRRSRRRSERVRDQARHRASSRVGGDDGGGRSQAHSAGAPISSAGASTTCGNCRPAVSIPAKRRCKRAKRELKEETGYRAKKWKKLVMFFPSPGFLAEKMTIFLATT